MKLMKHITIALVLCAIPAMAFGQTVTCDDCDMIAPVFQGEGGFVGMLADGAEEAVFVVACGNSTTSGEAMADDDGVVSQLFNMANGLACGGDDGSIEIGGLAPGAWYWITDDTSSAVGNLVAKDVLDNEGTPAADPGSDDITLTEAKGATFIKQASTGRVGILPTILPVPTPAPATLCGPRYQASTRTFALQQSSNCMLGNGGTKIRLVGPAAYGRTGHLTSGTVTRNASGNVAVSADLWVNESGSYATGVTPDPAHGWIGRETGNMNWLDATWTVTLDSAGPEAGDLPGAGVTFTDAAQLTIEIVPSATYCTAKASHPATVTITAAPGTNDIHPAVATAPNGSTASTKLTINCPPAGAAAQGQELVPDNPFPTDK